MLADSASNACGGSAVELRQRARGGARGGGAHVDGVGGLLLEDRQQHVGQVVVDACALEVVLGAHCGAGRGAAAGGGGGG
eukprot:SAG31_NODE_2725_length_5186_cov_4.147435_4_plen_80_part_00